MSINSITSAAAQAGFTAPPRQTGGPVQGFPGGHFRRPDTGDAGTTQAASLATSVTGQTNPFSTTLLDSLV